jgi:FkbM family methyltransferase
MHENASQRIEHIPVTTIDTLVSELNLPRVDFIKMDVKGSTERAIRGAAGVITKAGRNNNCYRVVVPIS